MVAQRCIGTNFSGERCKKHSHDICEDCGNPVCFFHSGRKEHDCDDSVEGCHSIWKHSHNLNKESQDGS